MRVSATRTAPRVERNRYSLTRKIKSYGENNDYPQKVLEIISSSGTGSACLNIVKRFCVGGGFTDINLASQKLNVRGETANLLQKKCSNDLKTFHGFAILVKYNGMGLPDEYYNIPFEQCRIEINEKKEYTGRVAVHPDWTGLKGLTFKNTDIKYFTRFNPAKVIGEMTLAGGPENYLGQIYYFTNDGDFEYPICPFDSIITDMLTEESVSTVKHRNAKFNFLPSGILVRKGIRYNKTPEGSTVHDDQYEENTQSAEEIKAMQGDEKACKIWVVDIDADEEKPEFIPFDAKNYDKQYELTERTVQENIGKMFQIPPILRGVDVGGGFGADLMTNAYNVMNAMTQDDRDIISSVFKQILENYITKYADYSISQLDYVDKNATGTILAQVLGVGGTQAMMSIIIDPVLTPAQKTQLLIKLFGFTEEDATKIMQQ